MFRRALPLVLIVAIAACGRPPEEAAPPVDTATSDVPEQPPAPFDVGASVHLTGLAPATGRVEVTDINAWTSSQRVSVACRVKHGTAATVSAREYVQREERWHFSITSGTCSGWVPQNFLEARP